MSDRPPNRTAAVWPEPDSLADGLFVDPPHPACLLIEELLKHCRVTFHRRGGPGGQHRNKVSSAVMILHQPSGISAEANERRDQTQNKRVALDRTRLKLALGLRTRVTSEGQSNPVEQAFRSSWRAGAMKINVANFDHIAVLALVLNDLHRSGGQPSLVAELWGCSTTALVQFAGNHPPAFQLVNRWREHHGRSPLR